MPASPKSPTVAQVAMVGKLWAKAASSRSQSGTNLWTGGSAFAPVASAGQAEPLQVRLIWVQPGEIAYVVFKSD